MFSHIYLYTQSWIMIYLIEVHLKGVLKSTLNEMVCQYAMSMWKCFSHVIGLLTLIYDLWDKHMCSQYPKTYVLYINVIKAFQ